MSIQHKTFYLTEYACLKYKQLMMVSSGNNDQPGLVRE